MQVQRHRFTFLLFGLLTIWAVHYWRKTGVQYRPVVLRAVTEETQPATQVRSPLKKRKDISDNLILRGLEGLKEDAKTEDTEPKGEGNDDQLLKTRERLDGIVDVIKGMLPSAYSNKTVNPCWPVKREALWSLSCLPAFFLMGYPKCGTTELFNILSLHSQFAKPYNKEPHWWTNSKDINNLKSEFARYIKWFNFPAREIKTAPNKITADCSASTVWKHLFNSDPDQFPHYSIPYIFSKIFPHAKYIVIMRDPISHLYSRFWYSCKLQGIVPRKLHENGPKVFEKLVEQHVEAMHLCMDVLRSSERCSTLSVRRRFLRSMSTAEKHLLKDKECGYIGFADCLYYISLKEWYRFIPHDRILYLRTEDLATDTVSVAQRMFRFLGMTEMSKEALERGIASLGHSNSQVETHSSNLTMTPAAREKLREFFRPYNENLADLLQDERFLWDK